MTVETSRAELQVEEMCVCVCLYVCMWVLLESKLLPARCRGAFE